MLVMKLTPNECRVDLPQGERLDIRDVEAAITTAKNNLGVWNVTLVISSTEWAVCRTTLNELGFGSAGSESTGTQTNIVLRKRIRTSGDGGGSVDLTEATLPPTSTEVGAAEEFVRLHPEYERYLRQLAGVRDEKKMTCSPAEQQVIDECIARQLARLTGAQQDMSRNNIIKQVPTPDGGLIVTFSCKDGDTRSYRYDMHAAAAILAGGDPKNYTGEEVSSPVGGFREIAGIIELGAELL